MLEDALRTVRGTDLARKFADLALDGLDRLMARKAAASTQLRPRCLSICVSGANRQSAIGNRKMPEGR